MLKIFSLKSCSNKCIDSRLTLKLLFTIIITKRREEKANNSAPWRFQCLISRSALKICPNNIYSQWIILFSVSDKVKKNTKQRKNFVSWNFQKLLYTYIYVEAKIKNSNYYRFCQSILGKLTKIDKNFNFKKTADICGHYL